MVKPNESNKGTKLPDRPNPLWVILTIVAVLGLIYLGSGMHTPNKRWHELRHLLDGR